jgi:titin
LERGALHLAVHDDHAEVPVGAVRGTGTLRLGIRDGATLGDAVGNAFDPVSAGRGDGGATATVAVVSRAGAPAAPALEQVPRGLRVTWTAPADDGGTPITGYTLEYRAADGGDWSSIGLPAGTRTHDVTGLSVGARYDIRVSAVTANGTGTPSAATVRGVVDVPHPPVAVRAESDAGHARVTWQAPADNGGTPVTHYVVRYRAPGETAWTKAGTVPASSRSLTIEALTAGTPYEFRVAAWNTVGGNPAAPTAALTIPFGPAAAPTGVVATTTIGGVLLRWTVPHDTGGSPIVGSVVEYRRLRDVAWTTLRVTSTPTPSITVGDLAVGGNYLFRVRAVTRAGAGEASQPSRAVTVPPVVPTATALAGGARVDWQAFGSTGSQPVIDYVVEYRRLRDAIWSVYDDGLSTGTSATLTGLSTGAHYTFRVRARSAFDDGATSASTGAVTIR